MGEGERKLGRTGAIQLKDRGAGGIEGIVGAGLRPGRLAERGAGASVGEGERPDGWAPPVSRERERERGSRLSRGVLGQNGRKGERGREKSFSFLFSNKFFKLFSK